MIKIQEYAKGFVDRSRRKEAAKLSPYGWVLTSGERPEQRLTEADRKAFKSIKLATIGFLGIFVICVTLSFLPPSMAKSLTRPDYGDPASRVTLNLKLRYGDVENEIPITVPLIPMRLSLPVAEAALDSCQAYIDDVMAGENDALNHVSYGLFLPDYHQESGVSVSWESSSERLSADGSVNVLGLVEHEACTLNARLTIGDYERDLSFVVTLVPPEGKAVEAALLSEAEDIKEMLGENQFGRRLRLPAVSQRGAELNWSLPSDVHPMAVLPMLLLIIYVIYFSRYDSVERALKRRAAQVEEELPNMALQLTLLLNSGLVVSSAFTELIEQNSRNPGPLYEILADISERSYASNLSFVRELYAFAQTTRSRSFLRLATLIADHAGTGSALSDKLENERDMLWADRIQRAKGKAKEAETKLCLPLMLLLLVLVVISIAPALMEM